jgi:hypothetical protein
MINAEKFFGRIECLSFYTTKFFEGIEPFFYFKQFLEF